MLQGLEETDNSVESTTKIYDNVTISFYPFGNGLLTTEKENLNFARIFRPKHIYVNWKKRTVTVWWAHDDTRTTVTCSEMDEFSIENGFRAALAKKIFGSYEKYSKYINKAIING